MNNLLIRLRVIGYTQRPFAEPISALQYETVVTDKLNKTSLSRNPVA